MGEGGLPGGACHRRRRCRRRRRRRFRETHVGEEKAVERKRPSAYARRRRGHLIIRGIFPPTTDRAPSRTAD